MIFCLTQKTIIIAIKYAREGRLLKKLYHRAIKEDFFLWIKSLYNFSITIFIQ